MSDETVRKDGSRNIREAFSADSENVNRDKPQFYEFGPFCLDSSERKLMRGNEIVAITPKAFDTLLVLVRNSGHLMEKNELLTLLWPDSFVEEGSLSNNIFLLRKALGEDPAFIETVPRRGYRFAGAVLQLPPAAAPPLEEPREADRELENQAFGDSRQQDRSVVSSVPAKVRSLSRTLAAITVGAVVMLAIGAALWLRSTSRLPDRSQWIPLTKLPDAVSQPALSPDGRVLAFIRSDSSFIAQGQIYVKMLPDGQPVELTHDDLLKMSPVFSPDGGRIAYTTIDAQFNWDTWTVPTLRGEPQPWLRNASGLVWSGPHHVVFSKMRKPPHMGVAVAEETRIDERDVYVPPIEPGMVHRSYPSPDGKWILLVEMGQDHTWVPCRLVPMDGTSLGHQVGPLRDACTFGAWSPDGKWMYFTSEAGGSNHIWRQRYPDGQVQQITSGPTEEEGIAMAPDGRSFVTAVTLANVSVWLHDAKGERQISLEGNAADPRFTPDGRKLCYRIVTKALMNSNLAERQEKCGKRTWIPDILRLSHVDCRHLPMTSLQMADKWCWRRRTTKGSRRFG
jgi:DNA-binding winged helix-turn-helix (wHTH) protein